MIAVEDLVVRYGTATALDGVSLTVHPGEMVALVGPNGAGKSTLIDTLSGVLRPASGRVRVGGALAHVPEGRQLFADLTVEDNLRLGAWRSRKRDPSHVYEVLPVLYDLRRRRAGALSGGQQQMVAVGRALMARPDVIAVDELSLGLAPIIDDDRVLVETIGAELCLTEEVAVAPYVRVFDELSRSALRGLAAIRLVEAVLRDLGGGAQTSPGRE